MSLSRLIQSFKDAMQGVVYVFKHEQNFRLQTFFGLIVILIGWFFGLSKTEWIVIIILIISVITLEFLNSAVERFADILKPRLDLQVGVVKDIMAGVVKPRLDLQVGVVKDIMAGVVFLASFGAAVIGVLIFYPYIIDLVTR